MSRTPPSSAPIWSEHWRGSLTPRPMDPQIAYLLGDTLTHTPFADCL